MQTGFFKLEHLNEIDAIASLDSAKDFCYQKIEAFIAEHPTAKVGNIDKAKRMVAASKSKVQLMLGVTSFAFAHPSENLKAK